MHIQSHVSIPAAATAILRAYKESDFGIMTAELESGMQLEVRAGQGGAKGDPTICVRCSSFDGDAGMTAQWLAALQRAHNIQNALLAFFWEAQDAALAEEASRLDVSREAYGVFPGDEDQL